MFCGGGQTGAIVALIVEVRTTANSRDSQVWEERFDL